MPKIVNNYIILEQIGTGQYSVVHRAKHSETGELAAIKILKSEKLTSNPEIKEMIGEEITALTSLDSPYIIKHLKYMTTTNNTYEVNFLLYRFMNFVKVEI